MSRSLLRRSFFLFATSLLACSSSGSEVPSDQADTGSSDTDPDAEEPKPVCGDGKKEGSELCDDGNMIGGDGCETDCTYTCKEGTAEGDKACDDGNPCTGTEKCGPGNVCLKGTPLAESASCGMSKMCKGGLCVDITCGDGVTTAPEECDDANTTNGDGCDSCKFTCLSTDTARNCKSTNACVANGTCADATHTCTAGANLADGTACGSGMLCKAGVCTGASCGNGTLDAGEECDPPAAGTCDATCKKITAAVCGNGKRETGEQCDDGNVLNLDGCDSKCKFEQDHRANGLTMVFTTDTFCASNQLGSAIASSGQSTIQTSLGDGVKAGTTNVLFKFFDLDDLTGTADPALNVGGLGGSPVMAPAGVTYDGTKDLDWWYTVDPVTIDATRTPPAAALLAAKITAKKLEAGPGNLSLILSFGGMPSTMKLTSVKIAATIGAASVPTKSTSATPGHLASANIDPALQSFGTMSNGQLCGNVTASSLQKVPVPTALLSGATACVEGFTTANSLLDVIIRGCSTLGGIIRVINPRQPDKEDPTVMPVGSGPPYTLSASSTSTKIVDRCRSGSTTYNAGTTQYDQCLNDAAYSAYFRFTTDRVIIK